MNKETQNGFTVFDDLPGIDPAVESLLGQRQRRQMDAHLPKGERSRKKKARDRAQARKPHRINLILKRKVKEIARKG